MENRAIKPRNESIKNSYYAQSPNPRSYAE